MTQNKNPLIGKNVKIYRLSIGGKDEDKTQGDHYKTKIVEIRDGLIFCDKCVKENGHPLVIGIASVKSIEILDDCIQATQSRSSSDF